jgi:hypothetical protein
MGCLKQGSNDIPVETEEIPDGEIRPWFTVLKQPGKQFAGDVHSGVNASAYAQKSR